MMMASVGRFILLALLIGIERSAAASGGRQRQHADQPTGLRGSSPLSSFILSFPPPPTRRPTPHPTHDFDAEYPTGYPTLPPEPTAWPTYDHESEMPTLGASSYFPTSDRAFVDDDDDRVDRRGVIAIDGPLGDPNHDNECEGDDGYFQLKLVADDFPCETSWVLERLSSSDDLESESTGEESPVLIDEHRGQYYDADREGSASLCLSPGTYRFAISDAWGDGLGFPGYYLLSLDGMLFGGSSDFGEEETTVFEVGGGYSILDQPPTGTIHHLDNYEDKEGKNREPSLDVDGVQLASHPPTAVPTARSTARPTARPTNEPIATAASADSNVAQFSTTTSWVELLSEDFEGGLGTFVPGSDDHVTYYPRVLGRDGVVRVYGDGHDHLSMIYSDSINLDGSSSANIAPDENVVVRVAFSYYANSMEGRDGFCLDSSLDDGISWNAERCWHADEDFVDGVWYDDVEATFELRRRSEDIHNVADGFRIRFRNRGDSDKDDVLIDEVRVSAGVTTEDVVATELKDSI